MRSGTQGLFVIRVPLDKDGNGPALARNTVKVVWQVWDADTLETVATADTEDKAEHKMIDLLEQGYGKP